MVTMEVQRLAVCLVGGARDFQLTGPSIIMFLLTAYQAADIFLLTPLDENSHKLSLLSTLSPRIVMARISPDVPINETKITDRILAIARSGPEAQNRQGLLQQFKAVEMCVPAITTREEHAGFTYNWILRTRVDGYWSGPPPPLSDLDPTGYTLPAGSDWGGLNDRLGVGGRDLSLLALRRLSVLPGLSLRAGYSSLNAERALKAQFSFLHIPIRRQSFPFCILSRKKGLKAFPVAASLSSSAPLNGAKCRPCVPTATGQKAIDYVTALPLPVFGNVSSGMDLCPAQGDWGPGWEEIFDRSATPQAAQARKSLGSRSHGQCVKDWEAFRSGVSEEGNAWDAPSPEALCVRGQLGRVKKLGFPGGDYPVFLTPLSSRSIVYSLCTGDDYYSFDWAMMRALRCRVHVFESTPEGLRWVSAKVDGLPAASWMHHPWVLAPKEGHVRVYPVYLPGRPVEYSLRPPTPSSSSSATSNGGKRKLGIDDADSSHSLPISVTSMSIESTMRLLNHSRIDVLRLGGHVSVHESIFASWITARAMPPVCQVIISFHKDDKHYGSQEWHGELLDLRRSVGLELGLCVRRDADYESCLLYSVKHCLDIMAAATVARVDSGKRTN